MKSFFELVGTIILGIVIIAVILGIVTAAFTPFFILDCNRTAKQMDTQYKYDFWAGCFLQLDDGSWVKDDYFVVPELR